MKTKSQLVQKITQITQKIHTEFPELSKYIIEMPTHFSGSDRNKIVIKNLQDYCDSLEELVAEYTKTHPANKGSDEDKTEGYPHYPNSEDIYSQAKEEDNLNPENVSKRKTPNEKEGERNEKNFEDDKSGSDLDVPGSELDDSQEKIGSEDEENNYYSLGGDAHTDLDEDNRS